MPASAFIKHYTSFTLTHARSLMIMLILGEENGLQRKNVADSFLEGKKCIQDINICSRSVSKTLTFARENYRQHFYILLLALIHVLIGSVIVPVSSLSQCS